MGVQADTTGAERYSRNPKPRAFAEKSPLHGGRVYRGMATWHPRRGNTPNVWSFLLEMLLRANPKATVAAPSAPVEHRARVHRNSSLQGAYLLMAARALGLDTGPIVRTNFLVNLGYGEVGPAYARLPRLAFDEVATIE